MDLEIQKDYTENEKIKISIEGKSELIGNDTISGHFLLNKDRSIHEIEISFYISTHKEEIKIHIQETRELIEQKRAINVVFDEKEEREKLQKSKSFFIEEIEDTTNQNTISEDEKRIYLHGKERRNIRKYCRRLRDFRVSA